MDEERVDGEVDEGGIEVTEKVASRGNVLDGVKKEVRRGVGGEEGRVESGLEALGWVGRGRLRATKSSRSWLCRHVIKWVLKWCPR